MRESVYLAGAGGMLGAAFWQVFNEKGYKVFASDIDVNETWLDYLDFRDFDTYYEAVKKVSPGFLVHLGAYTDLEYCEMNEDDTFVTNTISVENAVTIANALDIPLLYISTAGIFDGNKELYDDWDTPNPLGVYAKSKYLGERYVLQHARKSFVCRAGWMMGGGIGKDKKFINKLVKQILGGSNELFIVDDKDGTPTYTIDFATNCEALLRTNFFGLYNMVCGGQTSRLEVANELLQCLNLSDKIKLCAVKSSHFEDQYFAARPANERLVNRKLNYRNLNLMRDWKICLAEYVELEYKKLL